MNKVIRITGTVKIFLLFLLILGRSYTSYSTTVQGVDVFNKVGHYKVIMAGFPVNRFLTKEERNAVVNDKTFAQIHKIEKILKEVGMRAKIRGCKTSISMIGLLEE